MTDDISGPKDGTSIKISIEPVSRSHLRSDFDCGKAILNTYLKQYARQNDANNIARTFVAVADDNQVLGYYSLTSSSIEFEALPEDIASRLPVYPVPAVLIARLAVDLKVKGLGIGAKLLIDALQRIATTAQNVAVKVVLVEALDEDAKQFYAHYEFIELPGHKLKLFLPIETVVQLFV